MTKTIWAKAKVGTRLGRRSPKTIRMIPRDDHDVYLVSL